MADALPAAARRVQEILVEKGIGGRVRVMPDSTRSAAEAAEAIGTDVARIAKSIVFRARESGRAVLVVTSGENRVDEQKVATLTGETIGKADADFVRERTGFAIGGVAPVGHSEPPIILIDRDLVALGDIWAAAGTPFAVFPLTAEELVRATGGTVADIRKD